ncbi:Bug family tripartite tricarboxylate transporter substrate binding protein [Achromobacter sp. NPDC058515]|uniref:Bug family tripartite tricarboxylate transporter substrate binding protein n=1 Tax=Achromobacter sp. NPDC058515 TaxID=3346533 RepID=UPI003656483A
MTTRKARREGIAAMAARASVAALMVSIACLGAGAHAADKYPDRPITLIVPFSAGGDADLAARNLAASMRDTLGAAMVVANKAGANGSIGSKFVRDAAPDGYTLLLGRVGSQAILPALQADLAYKWDDFTFIGVLELNPMVCVVNAKSRYQNLDDLIAAIKANPGKLNYSTSGPATVLNLASQALLKSASLPKTAAVPVAYKGGNEATTAVLSGEVDFTCNNLTSLLGHIKGDKLRVLVTTSPTRLKDLPDAPTASELGHPKLEAVSGWSALLGPPGMDRALLEKWTGLLRQVDQNAQWRTAVETLGSVPRILEPKATSDFVKDQVRLYGDLGQALGIQIK